MRNVLEQHDIEAIVKNDQLYSVAGEVPITECMPEVWVQNWAALKAEEIIRDIESSTAKTGSDWVCGNCKELNDPSFGICWQCQTSAEVE